MLFEIRRPGEHESYIPNVGRFLRLGIYTSYTKLSEPESVLPSK